MDKQRAVNCDGLSADIFPSHILEAQETYTRAGTVKREEKLKVKHTHTHTHACIHPQIQTNRRSARSTDSLKMSGGTACEERVCVCVCVREKWSR